MRTRIIRVGNSRGIRIPSVLLEQAGLHGEVELELRGDHLVLRAADRARAGWDAAFASMAEAGDDALLDRDALPPTRWDEESWRW